MKKNTKRLRILLEALILSFLVGLLLAIVALSALDMERYRGEIISAVSHALGADVTAGYLKPSLFPYFGVEANDLTALHTDGSYEIDAEEVIVGVSLWRLLFKEIVPRKIRVSSVDVCIFLAEDESVSDSVAAFFNRPVMSNGDQTGIRDILFEDALVCVYDGGDGGETAYRARIFRAWLFQRPKKNSITFAVSLAPPGEEGRGRISAFGEYHTDRGLVTRLILREMDLNTLSLWFDNPGDPDISGTLGGSVDVRYLDSRDWAMEGRLKVEDISAQDRRAYPDGMYIERLHIDALVTSTTEGIILEGVDVSSDELDVSLDCVFDRTESVDADDPGLFLDVLDCRFEGVDLQKYLRLIPYGLFSPDVGDYIQALFLEGVLDGSLHIAPEAEGSDGMGLSLSAQVRDATLDLDGIVLRGVRADVALDGDTLTVKNVGFADPSNRVRELGTMVIDMFDRPYMDRLVVDIEEIPYEDLKDILVSGVVNVITFLSYTEGEGTVWGRLEISSDMGTNVGPLVIEGDVNFADWAVALPSVNGIFAPTDASIIFHDDTMDIPTFEMRYPTSHLIASGTLTNYEDPLLVMDVSAPVLDLAELFGNGESSLLWRDVETTLIYQEGYFILNDLTCSAYGGSCRGDFGYVAEEADPYNEDENDTEDEREDDKGDHGKGAAGDETSDTPGDALMINRDVPGVGNVGDAIFYLNMEGEGVDMGALMEDTGLWHGVSGTGSFKFSLTSAPVVPEEIVGTLDGAVSLEITDGTIRQYNALSKIVSVMNISTYFRLRFPQLDAEGFPFDIVTGDFTIEDGVCHTENLFIDSRVIRITCVGDMDMVREEVDMIIGFQVLKTVDLVINKIPVVGYILTGEDGNLFTTYFHVYGPMKDPIVETMTLQSLGEGTLHIFERIYRFPLKGVLPR
ncbi:MAG: AsmA-like C-terminal domain-containing protein [Deltaproteobacteria bacterium]|nr:AsmA-like C-terminal domain-containing protein [Candidatus Zymogenaceae bacterium]